MILIRFLAAIVRSRLIVWPLLALPFFYLGYLSHQNRLGSWKVADFQDYTGTIALYLLVLVLCLTPLRVLFPNSQLAAALNKHRRAVGLSCFFYACLHAFIYFKYAGSYEKVADDLSHFVFLQAGLLALVFLSVLAITSNNLIVRILSYPLWKFMHRLVYLAAVLIFFHRAFGPRDHLTGGTLVIFAPLALLEIMRVLREFYNFISGSIHAMNQRPAFAGLRKFRVARKVTESRDIVSVYLEPVDGKKLKPFKPGQYLTYELEIPGRAEPLVRCYSLSDSPNPKYYRSSIKRLPAPKDKAEIAPGISSNFFHDHVQEGDILQLRAPAGSFFLNSRGSNPVVLIGGGIGLTPVLSMFKAMADIGSRREVWFFYGARNGEEMVLRRDMEEAVSKLPNARLYICFSQPDKNSISGKDYHVAQRVTVDLLKTILPHNRYDFYFCGPGPMTQGLAEGLEAWKVPSQKIHFEEFGPSTVRRRDAVPGAVSSARLVFRRSKETLQWDGKENSLLEFAEKHGLKLRFGCRSGNCGSCKVRLLKGEILYPKLPPAAPGSGYVLTCSALPKGDLELDA